jgi:hypothetical protein
MNLKFVCSRKHKCDKKECSHRKHHHWNMANTHCDISCLSPARGVCRPIFRERRKTAAPKRAVQPVRDNKCRFENSGWCKSKRKCSDKIYTGKRGEFACQREL